MKKGNLSHKELILCHMRRYGFIEPLTALREYGIYRLGGRICDLRNDGYNIVTERMEGRSKITGNRVSYAIYRLKDDIQL